MKITIQDYNKLKSIIQKTVTENGGKIAIDLYHEDNTETRKLFDLFYLAMDTITIKDSQEHLFMRMLSDYLDDNNIETAMRRIYKEIR